MADSSCWGQTRVQKGFQDWAAPGVSLHQDMEKPKPFQEEKVGVVSLGVYKGRGDFFFNKNSSVWTELI
ncbi:mCG147974 [Mus musculus]|nr:mCG147974 [Mus musculus]